MTPFLHFYSIFGSPIFEHFCEDTAYSESTVCGYMQQVLKALQYLHSKNIVHLDLKPENLILDPNQRIVRLIDFGSAVEVQPKFPENFSDAKTDPSPEFLAPEIISSGPVGTYTDMWCFGVLLYVSLRLESLTLPLQPWK
jgi:serine/threonine protein kinase